MVDLWEDHSPLHTWKANTSFGPVLGGAEGHHSCPFFGSAASRKGPSSPSEGRAPSASLGHLRAQAAPTHVRARPEPLGSLPCSPPLKQEHVPFFQHIVAGTAAVQAIEQHDTGRPLFLYLAWQDVHQPTQPAPPPVERGGCTARGRRPTCPPGGCKGSGRCTHDSRAHPEQPGSLPWPRQLAAADS